jgi:hypothetical protein
MTPMTYVKFKEGKAPDGFDPKHSHKVILMDPALDEDGEDDTDFILTDRQGNFVRVPMCDLTWCPPPDHHHQHIPAHKVYKGQ